jgi:hypothetical protein
MYEKSRERRTSRSSVGLGLAFANRGLFEWRGHFETFLSIFLLSRLQEAIYIKLLISLPHAFIAIPSCLIHLRQAATVTPVIHIKPNAKMAPIAAANIHHNAAFLFMRPTTHFFAALILVVGVFR